MQDCVCQSDGTCEGTPKSSAADCDDGNPCTIGDHCDGAGSCVRGGNASNTTPCTYYLNPCAINVHCDGAGTCVAGGTKNVNEACTYEGAGPCGEGTCQDLGGGIIFCVPPCLESDLCHLCNPSTGECNFNPCSSDLCSTGQCDPDTGCVAKPDNSPCDDYDVCTSNDRCHDGECAGTAGGTPGPTSTPTATPPSVSGCMGDCNGDSVVTVDEIITGVDIALGNVDLSACDVMDDNGDDVVTVDEILTAVYNALNGCPPPESTPTPSPVH